MHLLRSNGWLAWRTRGSKSPVDVFAAKDGKIQLVQVKSTSSGGPFHFFGPADRAALREHAEVAKAEAFLCWWPPNKPARWIPEPEWPTP